MVDRFRNGWIQELLQCSGSLDLAPPLGSVFLCVGFILGIRVVVLSRFRFASTLLLSCLQKIEILLLVIPEKSRVHSHGPLGVFAHP